MLTDTGGRQAEAAGAWLREHGLDQYDRHYCSRYVRTMQTAALLGLPDAAWTQRRGSAWRSSHDRSVKLSAALSESGSTEGCWAPVQDPLLIGNADNTLDRFA